MPITSSNSTGTALGNAFSLPDTGWYVDDVTLAAPAGDEGIIRLVENVQLVGRIEGQNGRAERITGREYRFGDDYDTSGALRGTGSASNPAILTMVMRRADAPVGTNVTVSPTDGATVTFAQVVGGGDAGAIPRADATGTLPSGFVVTGSSVVNFNGYVDVLTTASPTGAFVTCMAYPDLDNDGFVDLRTPALPETQLRILHAENGSFVDRTVSLDPVHNIICAQTSSLSEFVVRDRRDRSQHDVDDHHDARRELVDYQHDGDVDEYHHDIAECVDVWDHSVPRVPVRLLGEGIDRARRGRDCCKRQAHMEVGEQRRGRSGRLRRPARDDRL